MPARSQDLPSAAAPAGTSSRASGLGFAWWWLLLPALASAASRGWWAPDEPRYAQVAREIFEGRNALVMHLCGELYPDKPPLLFWTAGVLGWLSGWSELAMRSVSIAAVAGTAFLTLRLGRRLWGRLEGQLAAALLLGTLMLSEIGGRLQIDPLLCFLTTAALVALATPAATPRAAARHVLLAGLCMGLGVLAKGPVAYVAVGLPAVAWRLALGRVAVGAGARAGRGAWIGCLLLAVLLPAAWAGAAMLADRALVDQLLFEQHVGKAVDGSRHPGPPWKHLWRMPLFLLPWTLPCLVGVAWAWRSWRARPRPAGAAPAAGEGSFDEGLLRAGLWLAVLVVFFSLLVSKRDLYLLPAYPAAALLGARVLARVAAGEAAPRASRAVRASGWIGVACFGLTGLALLGAALATRLVDAAREFAALAPRGAAAGLVLVLAAVWVARAVRRGTLLGWVRATLASWAVAVALAFALLFPAIDELKSPRDFALRIAARPERPSEIPCVGVHPEGYRFYGRIPTTRSSDLEAALEREGDEFLALVRERDWERKLEPELRERLVVVDVEHVGSRVVYLVARAGHAPSPPAGPGPG